MTVVKFTFALLILIPVAILMWQIISRLIGEFTSSVKKSADEEWKREKAPKSFNKELQEPSGFKHMMDKRKRRKERRKKKDKEK